MKRRGVVRHRKRRLRKEARTKPIWGHPEMGDGKDRGKYYHCWNCGFICDKDRDALGKGNRSDGVPAKDPVHLSLGYRSEVETAVGRGKGVISGARIVVGGVGHSHVIMEQNSNSSEHVAVVHSFEISSPGCPFCGSLNWKGENRL